jgi:hypothetical protein
MNDFTPTTILSNWDKTGLSHRWKFSIQPRGIPCSPGFCTELRPRWDADQATLSQMMEHPRMNQQQPKKSPIELQGLTTIQ